MNKIILAIIFAMLATVAGAQGLHPRAVMETKYDSVGNSPQTIFNNMPATGVKCFRVLDGDKTNINFAGLDCYNIGPSFTYNSATNQLDVVMPMQVNADWSANSGAQQILNKPNTLAGYGITDALTASAVAAGFYPLSANPSGYLTSTALAPYLTSATAASTYPTSASVTTALAGKQATITLTTTGSSGAATFNSGTGALNIPNYAPGSGTVTNITAGTGLAGGTITTSGTISLPNTGTAGTYSGVTTDAQGRVTAGTTRSFANPTRPLNTAFQISSTRDASVVYTVDISVTSVLLAGASGRVYLEYADDSGFTTNVVTVNSSPNATGGVLNVTNLGGGNVSGWIPASKYARIRTQNVAQTPVFTFQGSQEVLQ